MQEAGASPAPKPQPGTPLALEDHSYLAVGAAPQNLGVVEGVEARKTLEEAEGVEAQKTLVEEEGVAGRKILEGEVGVEVPRILEGVEEVEAQRILEGVGEVAVQRILEGVGEEVVRTILVVEGVQEVVEEECMHYPFLALGEEEAVVKEHQQQHLPDGEEQKMESREHSRDGEMTPHA